jgi:hypothetical protein
MERLWREPPPEVDWPRLDDVADRWTRELPKRYPGRLAEEALDAIATLTPVEDAVLCHQDLHPTLAELRRRLDALAELLGLDRERMRLWGLVKTLAWDDPDEAQLFSEVGST